MRPRFLGLFSAFFGVTTSSGFYQCYFLYQKTKKNLCSVVDGLGSRFSQDSQDWAEGSTGGLNRRRLLRLQCDDVFGKLSGTGTDGVWCVVCIKCFRKTLAVKRVISWESTESSAVFCVWFRRKRKYNMLCNPLSSEFLCRLIRVTTNNGNHP